jgi:hypothetical protein
MVMSKLQVPSEWSRARVAVEASESSVCIRIQPMPVPAQSVFKKRLGRIIASEARRRSDADLQLVPKRHKQTRPRDIRNRLPMVRTLERAERLHANLEERAIYVVERHKANKGTERLTSSRERPISDQIEFGLGRTVALKLAQYFIKTEQTHSKYARRVSKDVDHKRISSTMVLLPL